MSDRSPARGWSARFPADPVEDVLQHRTQISGQPALILDVGNPARPRLYSIPAPAIWRQCAGVELTLPCRVLLGKLVVHGEVGEDFEHPPVLGQRSLLLL